LVGMEKAHSLVKGETCQRGDVKKSGKREGGESMNNDQATEKVF